MGVLPSDIDPPAGQVFWEGPAGACGIAGHVLVVDADMYVNRAMQEYGYSASIQDSQSASLAVKQGGHGGGAKGEGGSGGGGEVS